MSRTRFGFCFARSGNVNETNDSPTPNPGMYLGFGLAGVPGGSDGKESVCNAGDLIYGFSEYYYECTQ